MGMRGDMATTKAKKTTEKPAKKTKSPAKSGGRKPRAPRVKAAKAPTPAMSAEQRAAEEKIFRERTFITAYFANGFNLTKAMQKLSPGMNANTASVEGSKLYKAIREERTFEDLLDEYGLDDFRIAYELNRLLHLKKPLGSGGLLLGQFDDGQTQAAALECLIKLKGRNEVNLNLRAAPPLQIVLEGATTTAPFLPVVDEILGAAEGEGPQE
jgi:hypothetical protein